MAEPLQIETRDRASIHNAVLDEWFEGWQAVFRPSAIYKAINIAAAGYHQIIPHVSLKRIRLVSLFFTVAGEVNVTFYDGLILKPLLCLPISGPMDFGGVSEPHGIVIPFPYSPLELSESSDFIIHLSAGVQVSGTVCYYYQ